MKIICFGKNYTEHANELYEEVPEEPMFFLKPDSALLLKNNPFYYPDFSRNIHYELELVVKINRLGKNIQERFAYKYYNEVALGIDFTARDLQQKAKEKGLPWALSKGFDSSAALSPFVTLESLGKSIDDLDYYLLKNKEKVQKANSSQMIYGADKLIAYVSRFMTLKIGDLIYTGTPAGIGAVKIGDNLEAYLEDRLMLQCSIK